MTDALPVLLQVSGIGFRTVDRIAQQLGFDPHAPSRYRCGLLFILRESASEGHCFGWRSQVGGGDTHHSLFVPCWSSLLLPLLRSALCLALG